MLLKSSLIFGLLAVLTGLLVTQASASTRSAGCSKPASITSGTYNVTIDGIPRQYTVRVPEGYRHTKANKVVLSLHWFGGTVQDLITGANKYGNGSYYGLVPYGGDSTIFVAPQGIDNGWMNANGDDLSLIDRIIEAVDNGLCVDTTKRYAVGFSFGGSMAYAIANTRGKTFRAVAILSGNDFTPFAGATVPVSVYVQHGVSDPGVNNPITQGRSMRDHFLQVNGCESKTAKEPAAGSGTHIKTEYKMCSSGKVVTYVAFDGVHQYSPMDAGSATSWVPSEIWKFFTSSPRLCE
ncbi:hypothetical protein Poli38472_002248 [Pythium oligandrum]|uniref:Feruloyl esterase n=1 Tax=Pythium oligandrum TaxID=41045 RepID=A0A8K1CH65_PYTOL|nr:hypothetical protein Poli38472_002248 [Pythium oligandrum]|eukprot:TMW63307.1 hypothetical protein Poli38472_002248 [Pythium oligandrum]